MKKYLFLVLFGLANVVSANESETKFADVSQEIKDNVKVYQEEEVGRLLTSVSEKDYYPMIKPGNWIGMKIGAVYQNFIGSDENPDLVIAYAVDTPEQYFFLNRSDEPKIDIESATKHAFKNLRELEIEYYFPKGFHSEVVAIKPGPFASETILSKKHMTNLQAKINADEFFVSIPTRTVLKAISMTSSDEMFEKFVVDHINSWTEHKNARISPYLFIVKDGAIVNYVDLTK
ncbi:hypothetical protein [Vibrio neptunius]|uniref:hypothetical protein n=1 Tax=Vibrio neptunius TaxID=170651 RepID=UPI0019D0FBD4|nr:hypothetical protein [Vibrio neptunius]MBN3574489.1 hypothetical protein [Vibrio neptunius]QXX05852.1 hypothetical protein KW548_11810 [Vibrio neptunius]